MFGFSHLISKTVIAAAALVLVSTGSAHAATGPFTGLGGTWSGSGNITLASGAKEQIRCKATYNVSGAGSALSLTLRCASASYKFELQSEVASNNGEVSGTWAELTNRVGGTIAGRATGTKIQVLVQGTVAAHLAVNTTENKQSISIESPGSPMSLVQISLNKGN